MDPSGVEKLRMKNHFCFEKKKKNKNVREWTACVHSHWTIFPAMLKLQLMKKINLQSVLSVVGLGKAVWWLAMALRLGNGWEKFVF